MSEMACNPYAADWATTCVGAIAPPLNPYLPDALLFTAFAPVVAFEWPGDITQDAPTFRPPWEDELTALAVQPVPAAPAWADWPAYATTDHVPVSEPGAAALLTVALLAGLWRMAK